MTVHKQPVQAYSLDSVTSDEIDLLALFDVLWQGKWIVLGVVVACLTTAVGYVKTTPKQYQVSARIYPVDSVLMVPVAPSGGGKVLGYGIDIQGPAVFYRSAIDGLSSLAYQKQFWLEKLHPDKRVAAAGDVISATEVGDFLQFSNAIKITEQSNDKPAMISISGQDPAFIAKCLTDFLGYVSTQVTIESIGKLLRAIDINILRIDEAIKEARQQADVKITDKAHTVQEALDIAKSLGIEEPAFERLANIEITLFNSRQYLLGQKALTSELRALELRRDKDAFVPKLRALQAAKTSLMADRDRINHNMVSFRPIVYPDSVSRPLKPVGPKSMLILIMALFLGGFLGMVIVFIRHGIRSYKARTVVIPQTAG